MSVTVCSSDVSAFRNSAFSDAQGRTSEKQNMDVHFWGEDARLIFVLSNIAASLSI